jgi:hypothetical protein
MDIPALAASLTAVLAPALPYLLKGGEKMIEGAIQKIGSDAWDNAKGIWQHLRPGVEQKPAALEAAQDLATSPENAKLQTVLEVQIEKILDQDENLAAELRRLLEQTGQSISYKAEVQGSGAIAQGAEAIAAGKGGIAIGGDVHGAVNVARQADNEKK